MIFNVPQFIEKEDKIVGPLTAKQLGWMFGAGAVLLVLWNVFDFTAFLVSGAITVFIFGALAFYKPNGQTLLSFILSAVSFSFRSKVYIWRRMPETVQIKKVKKDMIQAQPKKSISQEKIDEISKLLDNRREL